MNTNSPFFFGPSMAFDMHIHGVFLDGVFQASPHKRNRVDPSVWVRVWDGRLHGVHDRYEFSMGLWDAGRLSGLGKYGGGKAVHGFGSGAWGQQ